MGLKKYASVSPSAFGLGGKNRIAVVRARCPEPSLQVSGLIMGVPHRKQ